MGAYSVRPVNRIVLQGKPATNLYERTTCLYFPEGVKMKNLEEYYACSFFISCLIIKILTNRE